MNSAADPLSALKSVIERNLEVADWTTGAPKDAFLLRVRGRLAKDSRSAFAEIVDAAKPYGWIPMLRNDGEGVLLLIIRNPGEHKRTWTTPALFLITLISVIFTAAINALPASAIPCETAASATATLTASMRDLAAVILAGMRNLPAGLPFALSLLFVLGTHELGHYFVGRRNGTPVSLPFFIPLPLISPFGTLGAVISMKAPPRDRNALAEIGIAGPLSGFLVGVPLLLIGLSLSHLDPLPVTLGPCEGFSLEGNSLLYVLAKLAVFGRVLPAPSHFDIAPILFYARSFLVGFPFPMQGTDVFIHPIASGAWAGLMITGLNLIPAGQLDGGHLFYVLMGDRARQWLPVIIGGLVLLGIAWPGWFLLAALVFLLGRVHAEPLDTITPLDRKHRALAILGMILFALLFTPVPLQVFGA